MSALPARADVAPPVRLMLFPEAQARDPAVQTWLSQQEGELGAIARHWFDLMRACGSEMRELLHDGHPTACAGTAAFGYVNVFRDHVNVGFFLGNALPDPAGLLEGTGKFMRHVKLSPRLKKDERALAVLIDLAYARMQQLLADSGDQFRREP